MALTEVHTPDLPISPDVARPYVQPLQSQRPAWRFNVSFGQVFGLFEFILDLREEAHYDFASSGGWSGGGGMRPSHVMPMLSQALETF